MNPTSNEKKLLNPKDWFYYPFPMPRYRNYDVLPELSKAYLYAMNPFTQEYYSLLNPTFLLETNLEVLANNVPTVFIRDGGLQLLTFFWQYPSPPSSIKSIIIDESLQFLIPKEWYKKVHLYKILPTNPPRTPKKKLLVYGVVMTNLCDENFIFAELDKIKVMSKTLKLDAEFYFHLKDDIFYWTQQNALISNVMKRVSDNFGPSIKFHDYKSIEKQDSFSDYYIYEINEKMLYADSWVLHHLLTKEAHLLNEKSSRDISMDKSLEWLDLSLTYGVLIKSSFEMKRLDKDAEETIKTLKEYTMKSPKKNAYWPEELPSFYRKLKSLYADAKSPS